MKTLLAANNLRKAYGRQVVLDDLTFAVHERMKIALIGRNGAGKTTLLRMMVGADEPDGGAAKLMPDARLGTIDQHETLPGDVTTLDFLMEASGKPKWTCEKLASKLGLKRHELSLAPTELSGGYQMRVKLARMFLLEPNILVLDEPVNYLDLPTLVLFERMLLEFTGSYVITSHDREVLRNLCDITWEVSGGKLRQFEGDVDTYLDWKEEQEEFARKTNKKLRREIAHTQKFVDRFRYKAALASQAQSKLKHIGRLRTKLKSLERELPVAAFKITCTTPTGGTAVRSAGMACGYGDTKVIGGVSIEIQRGSKTAIVGENGRGKSTLLKTLAGELEPLDGSFTWWKKADIGYFTQLSDEALNPKTTVLQALTDAAPGTAPSERILATAGAFLFKKDDLEKTYGVLSGGERARVRLARLVLQEHNVLILDEPTNHLDAETVEVLAKALADYPGTVLFVSHARTFTNALADRIFEVQDGTVRHYTGTYEEYVSELMQESYEELADAAADDTEAQSKRERAAAAKERRRQIKRVEERMKKLDDERSAILQFFFDNPTDYAPDKTTRLSQLDEELAVEEAEWLKLNELQ